MNPSPTPRALSVWLLAALLGVALTLAPASASIDADHSLTTATAAATDESSALSEAANSPGISVLSLSQCASGYFCVWTETNYRGFIQRFTNQSQYTPITLAPIRSFYNNRAKRVYVYGDASGSPSACYGAQAKKSTTSSWLPTAEGTYLSTATSC